MVGFLGKQVLLSGSGLGANAEEHSTVTLKDGTIITGYFTSNSGPMSLYSFNPITKVTTNLGGYGDFSSNFSDPYLLASDDGGFKIIYNTISMTGGLCYRQYDKDGALVGAETTLDTGWIDSARSYDITNGFFVSYRDRTAEPGEPEYVGAFYNDAGTLIQSYDFTTGRTAGGIAHPEPQATLLSNGNLAVVWQKTNLDGSFLQIYKPNGTKAGGEKHLDNIPLHDHPKVIQALPDGGFVVAHAPLTIVPGGISTLGPIVIQKYANGGKKVGPEITFDTIGDAASDIVSDTNFDVAFTKEGLIAIAWTGKGATPSDGTDVYFAILSPTGRLIVGPHAADLTLGDDQLDVQFNTMKNGNLFLTFRDDATLQFHYVASIQGRFIVEPDYIWEGNGNANTKSGTTGNDVLLGLAGNDTLSGGKGDDTISGGARLDVLYGEAGDDKLSGDKGNDTLYGGTGNDILKGGDGDGDLRGAAGGDTIRGGAGDDLAYGGKGNDTIDGGDGIDRLVGGDGLDILRGGDDNDVLRGGTGDHQLYGDDGNDKLFGEAGNDTFHDEKGNDALFGGAGADTFQFNSAEFGRDRIKDFQVGVDVLDMGLLAYGLENSGNGSITATNVAAGAKFTLDSANWVIIENLTLAQLTEGVDYIIENPF